MIFNLKVTFVTLFCLLVRYDETAGISVVRTDPQECRDPDDLLEVKVTQDSCQPVYLNSPRKAEVEEEMNNIMGQYPSK